MSLVWDRSIAIYVSKNEDETLPQYKETFRLKLKEIGIEPKHAIFHAFCKKCDKEFTDDGDTICLLTKNEEQMSSIEPKTLMFFGVKCPQCRERCRILSIYKQNSISAVTDYSRDKIQWS